VCELMARGALMATTTNALTRRSPSRDCVLGVARGARRHRHRCKAQPRPASLHAHHGCPVWGAGAMASLARSKLEARCCWKNPTDSAGGKMREHRANMNKRIQECELMARGALMAMTTNALTRHSPSCDCVLGVARGARRHHHCRNCRKAQQARLASLHDHHYGCPVGGAGGMASLACSTLEARCCWKNSTGSAGREMRSIRRACACACACACAFVCSPIRNTAPSEQTPPPCA